MGCRPRGVGNGRETSARSSAGDGPQPIGRRATRRPQRRSPGRRECRRRRVRQVRLAVHGFAQTVERAPSYWRRKPAAVSRVGTCRWWDGRDASDALWHRARAGERRASSSPLSSNDSLDATRERLQCLIALESCIRLMARGSVRRKSDAACPEAGCPSGGLTFSRLARLAANARPPAPAASTPRTAESHLSRMSRRSWPGPWLPCPSARRRRAA